MRLPFFTIPVLGGDEAAAELDRFLAAHRIVGVERVLVLSGPVSAWAVCASWTPTRRAHRTHGQRVASPPDRCADVAVLRQPLPWRLRPLDLATARCAGLRALHGRHGLGVDDSAVCRHTLREAHEWLIDVLDLTLEPNALGATRAEGGSFVGFRLWPAKMTLSRRRKLRSVAAFRRAESESAAGRVGASGLHADVDAALSITAHGCAAAWRRAPLARAPALDA